VDGDELMGLSRRYPDAVFISAKTGEGLAGLEERVNKTLLGKTLRVEVRVPATDGKTIAKIRRLLGDPTDSIEDDHYVVEGTIESKTTGELERISGVSVRYLL
jgi:50S ribosomal subunit-associated GTPase HflX